MNETVTLEATPDQVAEYEATLNRYLAEMEVFQEQIAVNRRETQKLRVETETMLKNTLALLHDFPVLNGGATRPSATNPLRG